MLLIWEPIFPLLLCILVLFFFTFFSTPLTRERHRSARLSLARSLNPSPFLAPV
ncbi:hypothetical protein FA10DRAFT_264058 [Acaromyces ingoldii]|uniref:Uncharacterized protein n=1 Tax=Acaromyces ingoldii TaxID=215250 RepID=A0A316YVG2_9BASI|nr:hypothetical protein FA10DRAFT_264058 [Acaromyces ingoldii]PWN93407.1 hypothetical protein FA10DRAFT_264058 [Acaromyces ingoldii]